MSDIVLKANAKINLFLEVGGRRADGYHDIESVMQSVTLCDIVRISSGAGVAAGIRLACAPLPCDNRNIAYRAAKRFFEAAGITPRADISIEKHIPIAAGLAGGSTDCAAVLYGLNKLWGAPLSRDALHSLAATLGADVPFCLEGGTVLARGIGERLVPCHPLPECAVLIARRGVGVLTAEAYRELDASREGGEYIPRCAAGMLSALEGGRLCDVVSELYNAFSRLSYTAETGVDAIVDICRESGGHALLSGSGPSVFALFEDEATAHEAAERISARFSDAFCAVCRAANKNFE